MKKIVYIFLIYFVSLTIISCAKKDDSLTLSSSSSTSDNTSTTENTSPTEDISISSSASDNATFAFGQTYQYQLTTSGTYSDTITYSLNNQPEGMTISSSGLIEWFPTDEDEINETYSNITITITTASRYVFTQTFDLTLTASSATTISAGGWNSCAVLDNGSAKCWGENRYGQLGIDERNNTYGDFPGVMAQLTGINLGTGRTATAIAAGGSHNCAKLDNESVKCWGYNNNGQLGIGNTTDMGDDSGEMALLPSINL